MSSERGRLTFAVPALGPSPFLSETLDSLWAQTIPVDIRVRWVDRPAATPLPPPRTAPANGTIDVADVTGSGGIGADWEAAMERADTPLVCIAHADDIYAPRYAAEITRAFERYPEAGVAFSDHDYVDPRRQHRLLAAVKRRINPASRYAMGQASPTPVCIPAAAMLDALRWGCFVGCPTVTFQRPRIRKAIGDQPLFDRDLRAALDWQAWITLARRGVDFVYVPRRLVRLRVHEETTTQRALRSGVRSAEEAQLLDGLWPPPANHLLRAALRVGQTLQRTRFSDDR